MGADSGLKVPYGRGSEARWLRITEELSGTSFSESTVSTWSRLNAFLGALLMEQDEAWSTERKYFGMAAYWQLREKAKELVPAGCASRNRR